MSSFQLLIYHSDQGAGRKRTWKGLVFQISRHEDAN